MYLFSKQILKKCPVVKQFLFHLSVVRNDTAAVAAGCEAWLGNNSGEAEEGQKDRSRSEGVAAEREGAATTSLCRAE